jgi:hypothetical protein
VGQALAAVLRDAARGGGSVAHKALYAFTACVLRPLDRSGNEAARAAAVMNRARMWLHGEHRELWAAVLRMGGRKASGRNRGNVKRRSEEAAEVRLPPTAPHRDPAPAELDSGTKRRVLRLTRLGRLSKAASALSASPIAAVNDDTARELAEKHPSAGRPDVLPAAQRPDPASEAEVWQAIRSFAPGSAPGPSGLRAQHLRELVAAHWPLLAAATELVRLWARGDLPADARPTFCGAALIGLQKPDGSLRPIAVGETLRRLTAKVLATRVSVEAASTLGRRGQLGVAVKGGAEAAVHLARRVLARMEVAEEPAALIKIDFKNAFNAIDRGAVLAAVALDFPVLLPWAVACYGAPSSLVLGAGAEARFIASRCGVQQGDPLGPLFFSLALSRVSLAVREALHEAGHRLAVEAFYLDDGVLGGSFAALDVAIDVLRTVGPQVGVVLNLRKCEVVSPLASLSAAKVHFADVCPVLPASDWCLLGAPCGDAASREDFVRARLALDSTILGRLPELDDAHCAFALLRSCASYGLGVHYMRLSGALGFEAFDADVITTVHRIVGALPQACTPQIRLPVSMGGLGLRSCAEHAPTAYVVSAVAALRLREVVSHHSFPLGDDWALAHAVDHPRLAAVPSVRAMARDIVQSGVVDSVSQRVLSLARDTEVFESLFANASRLDRARLQDLRGPWAGAWLSAVPSTDFGQWLPSRDFVVMVRLRLGLDLWPGVASCPAGCGRPSDATGVHALTCMHGGAKTTVHDRLARAIDGIASHALWKPLREARPFVDGGLRCDVLFRCGPDGRATAIDVAVTHPQIRENLDEACRVPGGAPTSYETKKNEKYGPSTPAGLKFVPVVFSSFGSVGRSGHALLQQLAVAWGRRARLPPAKAIELVSHRISAVHAQAVASILSRHDTTATCFADDVPLPPPSFDPRDE